MPGTGFATISAFNLVAIQTCSIYRVVLVWLFYCFFEGFLLALQSQICFQRGPCAAHCTRCSDQPA